MSIGDRFRTLPTFSLILVAVASVGQAQYAGGTGQADDPYQIATVDDLIALGETPDDYDKHFVLTADLDLDPNQAGGKVFDKAVIAPDTDAVADRFQGTFFSGVFDGNDHVIANLHIQGHAYVGLFGVLTEGAIISNLALEGADVEGTGDFVGSLVAYNYLGGITTCRSGGVIRGVGRVGGLVGLNWGSLTDSHSTAAVDGGEYVGGLVGYNYAGDVTASTSTGPVTGDGRVGGLAGYNGGAGSVADCNAVGPVTGNGRVGGLVGHNDDGHIATSTSAGTVQGEGAVGGLVGANDGGIATSAGTAAVNGAGYVGGLVGYNSQTGTVSDSRSTGSVAGSTQVGGLVGANEGNVSTSYSAGAVSGAAQVGGLAGFNSGTVEAGFWDVDASGQAASAGGTGLATVLMQGSATYLEAGWDFADEAENGTEEIWWIDHARAYPRLWWEPPAEDPYADWPVESLVPVYRLRSPTYVAYFYTIDEAEKAELLKDGQGAWEDRDIAFYACADAGVAGVVPVYRFYSEPLRSYFYTTDASERDGLIAVYPDVWQYESIAFYVFAETDGHGALPIHRFWSGLFACHFYTIDEDEKTEFLTNQSDVWAYEGVIGYAYPESAPPGTN